MGSSKIDGYKELELYIQQAEEEISKTLSGVGGVKNGQCSNFYTGDASSQKSGDEEVLEIGLKTLQRDLDVTSTSNRIDDNSWKTLFAELAEKCSNTAYDKDLNKGSAVVNRACVTSGGNTGLKTRPSGSDIPSSNNIQDNRLKVEVHGTHINEIQANDLKIKSSVPGGAENQGTCLSSLKTWCDVDESDSLDHLKGLSDILRFQACEIEKCNAFESDFTEFLSHSVSAPCTFDSLLEQDMQGDGCHKTSSTKEPASKNAIDELCSRNGIYDNLRCRNSDREFVPLDNIKGQRPRHSSETCVEITLTGNPRKRSKSESYAERDSPDIFINGPREYGKYSSPEITPEVFDDGFTPPTFVLDSSGDSNRSTPVYHPENFEEGCDSECYMDRSNTPTCVQEINLSERSSTPTFVPSVDKTENIISSTLSKCRHLRRSKTDPGFNDTLKYALSDRHNHDDPFDVDDFDYGFQLEEIPIRKSVSSSPGEFNYTDNVSENKNKNVPMPPKRKLSSTGVQTSFDENCNEIGDKEDKLGLKKLLLTKVSTGTNTTDSLERPKKKAKEVPKVDNETKKMDCVKKNKNVDNHKNKNKKVDSVRKNEHVNNSINNQAMSCENSSHKVVTQSSTIKSPVTQSPIKKPTSFPSELITNMSTFENDESPEMQVIVNATSPVLFRRRSSHSHRTHGKFQVEGVNKEPSKVITSTDANDNPFMNSDMAKTWHGITSNKWKTYYAPIMRNMLQEMNNNNQNETENGEENQNLQYNSDSLRAKTLLDEMHKKYCSYQYKNRLHLPSPDDLILPIKLKSSPPPPNRMLSRSWMFRNYAFPSDTASSVSQEVSSNSLESKEMAPKSLTKDDPQASFSEDSAGEATPTEESSKVENLAKAIKQKLTGKEDAEIEAVEACRWLKEAGFPQYSQMYDDGQFPVDIASVEKDHDFLDKDSMQPLIRRLSTLNKCAIMRISTPTRKNNEDSDDDDQCALSDKWKYQHNIRRWSRKDLNSPSSDGQPTSPVVKSSSSNDSLLTDQNSSSETGDSPVLDSKMHHTKATDDYFGVKTSTPVDTGGGGTSLALSPRLRRAASERIKGAKNFLKRVESFKSRKTRKIPRTGHAVEISGPVVTDSANMQAKIKHLNCKDLSPSSEEPPSPIQNGEISSTISAEVNVNTTSSNPVPEPWSDDSTNYKLPTTKLKTPSTSVSCQALDNKSKSDCRSDNSLLSNDNSAIHNGVLPGCTGSTPVIPTWQDQSQTDLSDLYILPTNYKPGSFPKDLEDFDDSKNEHRINHRTGSFNLGHENCDINSNTVVKRRGSMDPKLQVHRHSIYDNVPIEENLEAAQEDLDMILDQLFQDINGLNKTIYGEDAEVLSPPSSVFKTPDSKPDITDVDESIDADDSSNGNDQENDVISGTVSSPDSSDHDIPCEELSHDESGEHIVYRERRDSGVGSSLTRAPSDRRRYRIRWHSFQKSHRPSIGSRNLQVTSLSVCQLMVLQKLSLVRLTGLIEKYSPNKSSWTWTVPRFMKRHKAPDYSEKSVFSVPLLVTLQRTGQPLPQCILHAMRYLRKTAGDAVGIFRKSGVRSRIQKLKNDVEDNAELVNFEELQAYDVADLVKQYFRELPECLLTNKLSEIFFNIFIHLPAEHRVDALQSAIFLLPDENREVLQSLLLFLGDIATHANEHQMTASNLAVCFAPSLFNMGGTKSVTQSPSPRRPRKNLGVPDARELMEQQAARDCLTTMINECKKIFMIPVSLMSKCRFSYIEQGDPVSLDELIKNSTDEENGYHSYVENCVQGLLKESRDKSRGWISMSVPSHVDVSYKKVADGHPLRLWKCCVDVEAPPDVVLDRIKNERHTWDEDMLNWKSIEKLDNNTEIFQYVRNSMAPHPSRDYCVLRCWKTDLPKGACALISTSVEHPKAELLGGIRAVELASHYLIEPCGTGKSRITHMSRLDMRGRTPEWYKKAFGHIFSTSLERIQDSFKQNTEGPESTV